MILPTLLASSDAVPASTVAQRSPQTRAQRVGPGQDWGAQLKHHTMRKPCNSADDSSTASRRSAHKACWHLPEPRCFSWCRLQAVSQACLCL